MVSFGKAIHTSSPCVYLQPPESLLLGEQISPGEWHLITIRIYVFEELGVIINEEKVSYDVGFLSRWVPLPSYNSVITRLADLQPR